MEGKGENETRTEGVLNCLVWQSHPQMYPSASQNPSTSQSITESQMELELVKLQAPLLTYLTSLTLSFFMDKTGTHFYPREVRINGNNSSVPGP